MRKEKRKRAKDVTETTIEQCSGNVFEDLALAQPEELLAKAELVHRIREIIAEKKLTQRQAAAVLGVDQPKISALARESSLASPLIGSSGS